MHALTGESVEQAALARADEYATRHRLTERANAAAADVLSRFDDLPDTHASWLRPLLSIAWLEGWDAGGDDVRVVVGEIFDRL